MKMMNNELTKQLDKHNNVLLYKQELYECFKKRDKTTQAVYIPSPRKGKNAIGNILKALDKGAPTKNKTVSMLIEEIQEKSRDTPIHVYVDSFEQLSKRELPYYKELSGSDNILLVVNFKDDKEFVDEDFLEKFIILNKNEFQDNRSHSINITFTILLLFSVLIFLIFLRLQLSVLSYLINALWFSLLMYRSFYYVIR